MIQPMRKHTMSNKTEADQYKTAGSNGKVITPPRRPAPKLQPGQGVGTVAGHKRGQDKG
jgi:hypothetical protein